MDRRADLEKAVYDKTMSSINQSNESAQIMADTKQASTAELLQNIFSSLDSKEPKQRKVLIRFISGDAMLIITDAPAEAIKIWACRYDLNLPEDRNEDIFKVLTDAGFYVSVLTSSVKYLGTDDDFEVIGWSESYDLANYLISN